MCGIIAIASDRADLLTRVPAWIDAMGALNRRGPDDSGSWISPAGDCALGHTRLAIRDLSDAGAQPMCNEDGDVCVSFNGEIYNDKTLRHELKWRGHEFRSGSDTEVLVHGFEQWGIEGLLDRLRGMFAFVIWDGGTRVLHGAVDHAGMKPLVYHEEHGVLRVASDCDALRCLLDDAGNLDRVALAHVLCHGFVPAPMTVWQGVKKLRPGSRFTWSPDAGVRETPWWRPTERAEATSSEADFEELWRGVVERHLVADVPVSLLLSGGIDSTAIACEIAGNDPDVRCATLSIRSADDEGPAGSATASSLSLPHTSIPVDASDIASLLDQAADAFDEPQAYGSLLTMCAVAQGVAELGKVVISGDGGDEAFAGYTWHQAPPDEDAFVRSYQRNVFPRFHPSEAGELLGIRFSDQDACEPFRAGDAPSLPWPRRAQRMDLMGFCAGHICPKVDRAMMHHSVELRCPFLDRDLLEWALRLPVDQSDAPKGVLRRHIARRMGDRARPVLERPKQGFSLRLDDRSFFATLPAMIEDSALVDDGIIEPQWRSHVERDTADREGRLYALAFLARWHERRRSPCATPALLAGTTRG